MIGCLCWICAFASSTSYNEFFTWSSFLNSLQIMAASFFWHWGTSLQCIGSSPWSGIRRRCWLEASLFLRRYLSLDFRHLAFLRPLLTAQNRWSISLECTQQNGVLLCKQDPIVDKKTAEEYKVFHSVSWRWISTFFEVRTKTFLLRHSFWLSLRYHAC